MEYLCGCDTFVVMGDVSETGEVIFGKNSDRPSAEVQDVIYSPASQHTPGTLLRCTYIEIEQAAETLAVVLSKPSWMWGAEMGANHAGVVIGNEAVWDRLSDHKNDLVPRLLGMDLVRLGLERSSTASQAVDVITSLLEEHGQGGGCSDIMDNFAYHNTFLIADPTEAWVLETADRLWAAEKVDSGCRNISNCMSITTKIDRCSSVLKSTAMEKGWWDGNSSFNWVEVIGGSTEELVHPTSRWNCGRRLLKRRSLTREFNVTHMMKVLRDEASGINMTGGVFRTTGSQVSALSECPEITSCHWFTATPVPSISVFKPFIFCGENSDTGKHTTTVDNTQQQAHALWTTHEHRPWLLCRDSVQSVERKFLQMANEVRQKKDLQCLFSCAVKEEMKVYADHQ